MIRVQSRLFKETFRRRFLKFGYYEIVNTVNDYPRYVIKVAEDHLASSLLLMAKDNYHTTKDFLRGGSRIFFRRGCTFKE